MKAYLHGSDAGCEVFACTEEVICNSQFRFHHFHSEMISRSRDDR